MLTGAKSSSQLSSLLQRVLLLDSSVANGRMMADLVKDLGGARIHTEVAERQAMETCKQLEPQLIITEFSGPMFDGLKFTKALRRSGLACRAAPVIMVTAEATAAAILGARNAGVHEFLRKPFAIRDLSRRIEAVMLNRREWVEAMNYVGPDRRRFNSGDFRGPRKRRSDSAAREESGRIEQALRILKSAFAAVETDPAQARRSIQAQASDLHAIAVRTNDMKLMNAVATLQRALIAIGETGPLSRRTLEVAAEGLWAFMPATAAPDRDRVAI
jgi:two-component system, response regulator PdtaR